MSISSAHHAREITHGERWLVRLGQAVGERDALRVFEAVGEDARDEIVLRLRRMPHGADRERLVDAAIDVGQLDLEAVERHGSVRLQEMVPLRAPAVVRAEAATPLQLGDDQVGELLDGARAVDGRDHETVAADKVEIGLELIGNLDRSANELRQTDRLAVISRNLLRRVKSSPVIER